MLSGANANTNRDFFCRGTTVHDVRARRLRRIQASVAALAVACIGLGTVLTGCGAASSDQQWARITARTCASTIARARLAPPTEAQLALDRFLVERQRLLNGHRAFNTVTPFRNVCLRIRDEIRGTTTTTAASGPDSALEPANQVADQPANKVANEVTDSDS